MISLNINKSFKTAYRNWISISSSLISVSLIPSGSHHCPPDRSTYPVSRAPNSRIPKSPRESVSRLSLPLNKNLSRRNGWPIRSYCPEIPPIAFPGFHSPRLSRFTRPHYFCGSRNGIRLERATLKGEPSGYRFIGTARKVLKNNRTQPVPLCSRRNHARLAVCMQMRPPPPPAATEMNLVGRFVSHKALSTHYPPPFELFYLFTIICIRARTNGGRLSDLYRYREHGFNSI